VTRLTGTLYESLCTFMVMRNFSDRYIEKMKTQSLCSLMFSENHAVYEIIQKIMVEPDRPQMTTGQKR